MNIKRKLLNLTEIHEEDIPVIKQYFEELVGSKQIALNLKWAMLLDPKSQSDLIREALKLNELYEQTGLSDMEYCRQLLIQYKYLDELTDQKFKEFNNT